MLNKCSRTLWFWHKAIFPTDGRDPVPLCRSGSEKVPRPGENPGDGAALSGMPAGQLQLLARILLASRPGFQVLALKHPLESRALFQRLQANRTRLNFEEVSGRWKETVNCCLLLCEGTLLYLTPYCGCHCWRLTFILTRVVTEGAGC